MEAGYTVILFYKFVHLEDPKGVCERQRAKCRELGLLGRVLVATEGINATLEGLTSKIEEYKAWLWGEEFFGDVVVKESAGMGNSFVKLKCKVRPEVVTLGTGEIDASVPTARELSADELQAWYEGGEDFVVLDLRNSYEIASGKFDKTINPELNNFRDLVANLDKLRERHLVGNKKIVTVCTGGIRCEKATKLMGQKGFDNLYQLKDGIHTYMSKYPGKHFKGTLFVFDNRMTTDVVDTSGGEHGSESSDENNGRVAREIIGKCYFCDSSTEQYYNDDSHVPSQKVLCCEVCIKQNASHLRPVLSVM